MPKHRKYYKGEGDGFPQVWAVMSLVSFMFACGSSVHQKCSNHALTNLLFGLCRSMWIINMFIARPSPHPKALVCPSTPEVLQAKEHTPTPYPSVVFTFALVIESIKEFGDVLILQFLILPLFSILDSQLSLSRSLGCVI